MTKIIKISALAALVTSSLVGADIDAKLSEMEAKINALQTQLNQSNKTLSEVKAHDGNDNIKFDVDFRTAMDNINYKMADGTTNKNPDLLTNRLWLNMGYSPNDNTIFKGKLSYLKAFGDSANHSQSNSAMGVGFANFDWVTNENAIDNNLKVKEAYWLYKQDTLAGSNIPWTMSIGRRPSTDGLGINLREGQKDASPLSHTVNVEFDGLSSKLDLDKVTGVKGMSWKLCTGRGMTNALPRFNMTASGADYAPDKTKTADIDMYGFIFVPYDNGQYSVSTNWAKANNMIGFKQTDMNMFGATTLGYNPGSATALSEGQPTEYLNGGSIAPTTSTLSNPLTSSQIATNTLNNASNYAQSAAFIPGAMMAYAPQFKNFGDLELFTAIFKAEGVGEGINDFLDNTKVFASWAQSKTIPASGMAMLGSTEQQTGTSTWIGVNIPCPLTKDGRIGLEWNKGSKYWRPVTYGEDTMAGSKIAARGTAVEVYYAKPINKALSWDLRYTDIKYDYTGSNSFFGEDGTPIEISTITPQQMAQGMNPVKEARDIRASISYRF